MTTVCQDHWDRMRRAIDDRGLGALVPDSGELAREVVARELAGERSIDTFDPLMNAFFMIMSKTLEYFGPWVLAAADEHRSGCLLCFMNEKHEHECKGCDLPTVKAFDHWIDKAADASKAEWLKRAEAP